MASLNLVVRILCVCSSAQPDRTQCWLVGLDVPKVMDSWVKAVSHPRATFALSILLNEVLF